MSLWFCECHGLHGPTGNRCSSASRATLAQSSDMPCTYECSWVAPYGFVPEADCPVHDSPSDTPVSPTVGAHEPAGARDAHTPPAATIVAEEERNG